MGNRIIIDEQSVHVFMILFGILVFFTAGIFLLIDQPPDAYTGNIVGGVETPEFNATAHEPDTTDVLNVSWENTTVGYNFTVPAGEWEIAGWLGDAGWFADVPDNYTFTIWNSFSIRNTRTIQLPSIDANFNVFQGRFVPRLGADFSEIQDYMGRAPRVVRWSLISIPIVFVLMLIRMIEVEY